MNRPAVDDCDHPGESRYQAGKTREKQEVFAIEHKKERRVQHRYACSNDIFFATQTRFYEGQLDNYSRNGLFIQTNEDLLVGEVVTVVDPNPEGDNEKRQGQIVWKNREGFGVELFHSREEREQKALRFENRILHREGNTLEA